MKYMFLLLTVMRHVKSQDADGYTDENRPYKFAFNIEGYQHRSEEKDEKGIVKGEYGFVTGDGIYHVTVYATDENGNFRIVSMKNYYIGLPNESTTAAPITTKKIPQTTAVTVRKLDGIQGCDGCLIPTSTSRSSTMHEEFDIDIRFGNDVPREPINNVEPMKSTLTTKIKEYIFPLKATTSLYPDQTPKQIKLSQMKTTIKPIKRKDYVFPLKATTVSYFDETRKQINNKPSVSEQNKERTPTNTPKYPNKPQSLNDNKFTNLQTRDPSALLYEFNHTQTYQGHKEKGFLDHSKEGNYFVNGRDGIKQIVEYVADDSGYQPHIRFEKLSPSETPNLETEKLENVLKTVYFRWFNRNNFTSN